MGRVPDNIKRGLLSEEEKAEIERLADRGFSSGRIAQRMNRHPATIGYAMHRMGLRQLKLRSFSYMRNGKLVKSFSREEDAYVLALRIQGYSVAKIAELTTKRFGHTRSDHTINVRLVLLSNAEAA